MENQSSSKTSVENGDGHLAASAGLQNDTEKDFKRTIRGWKWALMYTAMVSTTFLFALDNTIVADVQPAIISDFGRIELLPWIGTGFALGSLVVLPWGKVYGIFNIKWTYITSIILFEVGSTVCGAAPNMEALILGRVIAGVGGAGMYSGTLNYISVLTEDKERTLYLAGSTVLWGVGSVLGPVVGGAFAISSATWRWGFYINLVVGALFAPAYILLCPPTDPRPNMTLSDKVSQVDWLGMFTFLAGSACLVTAISFGGVVYDFSSGTMIALWTVAGIFFPAMILVTKFHPGVAKENRLYPAHFLRKPILVNMQVQVFLSSGVILSMTYYIPLYFQFVRGDGPLDAGVRLLPLIIFEVFFSIVNGVFMLKYRYISPWFIGGSMLATIGTALMCTVTEQTPNENVYGYTILIGTGIGCFLVAGFAIVQFCVSPSEVQNAVGAMTISQTLGMVLFLAIGGSIFQNIAIGKITEALPALPEAQVESLMAGAHSEAYISLSPEEQGVVIGHVTSAMGNVWIFFTVAAGVCFLSAFPLLKFKVGDR